jgi:DNA-binding NarL/FixJ family response regulator
MSTVRILVADDLALWRRLARAILQERPEWEIIEAGDGLEAVRKAAELSPDIVLLDIEMPILNGIEAAKRIRQQSPAPRIIFVTENNDTDLRSAVLADGAEGYVLKVNAATELLPVIAAALCDSHPA